ncbi:MAG: hypothetical protein ACLFV3_04365 [Phycisphaeraceae bacterium]
MAEPSTPPPSSEERPRRRRRWPWVLLGVFVLLLILVGLAPTLLSTGPGEKLLLSIVNGSIPGRISADDIHIRWFGNQRATHLVVRDPEGNLVAEVPEVRAADLKLLSVLVGNMALGQVQVTEPHLRLEQQPGEPTNLEQAVSEPKPKPRPQPQPEEPLSVDSDLSVALEVTGGRVTYTSPGMEPVELTDLDGQLELQSPRDIRLALKSQIRQGQQAGQIAVDQVTLRDAFTDQGEAQFDSAHLEADAEIASLPVAMVDRLARQGGSLVALLGDTLDARMQAAGLVSQLEGYLTANSPTLKLALGVESTPGWLRLVTPEGETPRLTLRPEVLDTWLGAQGENQPRLAEPFTVLLLLRELRIPKTSPTELDLGATELDLSLQTADAVLLDVPDRGRVALRDLVAAVQSDRLAEQVTGRLDAEAELDEVARPVQASLAVRHLLGPANLAASVGAQDFPVVLADLLLKQQGGLVATLGRTLALNVDLEQDRQTEALAFQGRIDAPHFAGPFTGRYDADGLLAFQTPEPMRVEMTQLAFRHWAGTDQPVELVQPLQMQAKIDAFQIAMREPAEFEPGSEPPLRVDPERTRISAAVEIESGGWRNTQTGETWTDVGGRVTLEGQDLRDLLLIMANMEFRSAAAGAAATSEAPAPEAPSVRSRTEIRGLVDDAGYFRPEGASYQTGTTLDRVPSALLTSFAGLSGDTAAVLGPQTSGEVTGNYAPDAGGELTAELDASNLQARIPAAMSPERLLTLREDATVSLANVAPGVRDLLKAVNPVFNLARETRQPIGLRVASEGFAVPLDDPALEKMQLRGRLAPGQLTLSNEGLLAALLTAVPGTDAGQAVLASFEPMDLAIEEGILAYDGMRMTMGNLVLGFEGQVNLETEQLDLAVQLPMSSLAKIVHELDEFDPDQAIVVPLTGTIDNPQLDRDVLTRQMAEVIGRGYLEKELGGEAGQMLGEILGGGRQQRDRDQPRDQQQDDDQQDEQQQRRGGLEDLLGDLLSD